MLTQPVSIIVALLTPFDINGNVDVTALKHHVEAEGLAGLKDSTKSFDRHLKYFKEAVSGALERSGVGYPTGQRSPLE